MLKETAMSSRLAKWHHCHRREFDIDVRTTYASTGQIDLQQRWSGEFKRPAAMACAEHRWQGDQLAGQMADIGRTSGGPRMYAPVPVRVLTGLTGGGGTTSTSCIHTNSGTTPQRL